MNIVEAYHHILSKWKIILLIEAISIAIAIVLILSIPKEYTSTTILAPETKASTVSYGLTTSILNNGSLNLTEFLPDSRQDKDAIYPLIYPLFFESNTYPKSFFSILVPWYNGKEITLQNYIDNDLKYPWWSILLANLFPPQKDEEHVDQTIFSQQIANLVISKKEWATIKRLQDRITLTVDNKTFVMTIAVTMQDPVIAAVVADSVSRILRNTITDYRIKKAQQNLVYIQTLYDNAKTKYLDDQIKLRKYQDTHYGISTYEGQIELDRLQNEANQSFSMYNHIAKQLQLAAAKVEEDRPVFAVLNPPIVPLKPSYPSKFLFLLGFFIVGGLISLWYIFK